jgi:hypothetical protein
VDNRVEPQLTNPKVAETSASVGTDNGSADRIAGRQDVGYGTAGSAARLSPAATRPSCTAMTSAPAAAPR